MQSAILCGDQQMPLSPGDPVKNDFGGEIDIRYDFAIRQIQRPQKSPRFAIGPILSASYQQMRVG